MSPTTSGRVAQEPKKPKVLRLSTGEFLQRAQLLQFRMRFLQPRREKSLHVYTGQESLPELMGDRRGEGRWGEGGEPEVVAGKEGEEGSTEETTQSAPGR